MRRMLLVLVAAGGCWLDAGRSWAQFKFDEAADAQGYEETFGVEKRLGPQRQRDRFRVTLIQSSAVGNILHPGEQPRFVFQLESQLDQPLKARGRVEVIRYVGKTATNTQWVPRFERVGLVGEVPIQVDLPPRGWVDLTIEPPTPEDKGGYALVVELDGDRQLLTHYVRTFAPAPGRTQHPKQALEYIGAPVLERLGVQAVRYGVPYLPSSDPGHAQHLRELEKVFSHMHAHRVTCLAEIGTSSRGQPLGRGRPHLDDRAIMLDTKQDLVWLPEFDEDYERFVYDLAVRHGWPNGPITGFMLWNEPWQGMSISGWGADIPRYRELYRRMGDAIFRARRDAGVDVMIGGCDSPANTWDNLFPEGLEDSPFWPQYLDFCSVHYAGLAAPARHVAWNRRSHGRGRVLVFDTESWFANTDDRFIGIAASCRAAGYDRYLGIRGSNVVGYSGRHGEGQTVRIQTPEGPRTITRPVVAWPVAAAIAASQHLLGDRPFREIRFKTGLPWVFVFDGLEGRPDDGTVVIVGDMVTLWDRRGSSMLFKGVRSLAEVQREQALTGADAVRAAADLQPFENVSMQLPASPDYAMFDVYGNSVPHQGDRLVVPLEASGYILRANASRPGSFERLLAAIDAAEIVGLQPVEIVAADMLAPIDRQPVIRLRLTNQLPRSLRATLSVNVTGLSLDHPREVELGPREQRWVEARVVGGQPSADNRYPMTVRLDAGPRGLAIHRETMRVNWIARRTITVDGDLTEWNGILPQVIDARGEATASHEEAMWLPFESFGPGVAAGLATGYLAYDDEHFYFAARIADDSPHPGTWRFAARDADADFYPPVAYEMDAQRALGMRTFSWSNATRQPYAPQAPDIPDQRLTRSFGAVAAKLAIDLNLPEDRTTQVALYFLDEDEYARGKQTLTVLDRQHDKPLLPPQNVEAFGWGKWWVLELSGSVRIVIERRNWVRTKLSALMLDPGTASASGPSARLVRVDDTTHGTWQGVYGRLGMVLPGLEPKLPEGMELNFPEELHLVEHTWPTGVRRFSYRRWPMLPSGYSRAPIDNVLLAFNAIPLEQEPDFEASLPGRMPRYGEYVSSDYQYALNAVAPAYGGGTEVWRLMVPGMPRKHFYPRQPSHPREGAVTEARLVIRHENGQRIVEAAIPWTELPHVQALAQQGEPVRFSFRVNHDRRTPTMELSADRSIAEGFSRAFLPDWETSHPNEVAFGWE